MQEQGDAMHAPDGHAEPCGQKNPERGADHCAHHGEHEEVGAVVEVVHVDDAVSDGGRDLGAQHDRAQELGEDRNACVCVCVCVFCSCWLGVGEQDG